MAKKTVFRRLAKWIPQSAELQKAADLDDDQIDFSVPSLPVIPATQGDSRTDELANLLAARTEEPEGQEATGSVVEGELAGDTADALLPESLSELCLDFEAKLSDAKLKRQGNVDLYQGMLAVKNKLTEFEFDYLKKMVDANTARLK